MDKFEIGTPERLTVTFDIEVVYDSSQFRDESDLIFDVLEIVWHADWKERNECLRFEEVTYIKHTNPFVEK